MNPFISTYVFIFGAAIGSFLNVCIWRLPRNESIIKPRSYCPFCRKALRWADNIPILSFIFLGGRCRYCRQKISFRYPVVELLTGLLFLVNFLYFGISVKFFIYTALECALVVATFTDLMHFVIPDEITIGGLAPGLILSFLFPQLHGAKTHNSALLASFFGIIAGGGIVYAVRFLFDLVYFKMLKHPAVEGNTESMGEGDIKLLAMIGAFVGWKKAALIFFIAPFFGIIAAVITLVIKKSHVTPYGPYLSLAAFTVIMWGDGILKILLFN